MYFLTEKYGCVKCEVKHKGDWVYAFIVCTTGPIAVQCFTHEPTCSELQRLAETL